MTDDNDPTDIDVDDLVFEDDLETFAEKIEEKIKGESPDTEGFVEPEDAQSIADATFMDRLEHLVHDDCDTEQCNEIRDAFGIGGETPAEDGEASDESDADEDVEPESNEGDGSGSADDDVDSGGDDADEPRTNAFGEPY